MDVCLVGTGGAAAAHARALQARKSLRLRAVCGSAENHVREFARQYAIPSAFCGLERMLEQVPCQLLVIASIPSRHLDQLVIASRWVRQFVVEKPVVRDAAEVAALRALADSRDLWVSVVYQNRLNQAYRAFEAHVRGREKEIVSVVLRYSGHRGSRYFDSHSSWRRSWFASGGGVLMQNGIHWINQLLPLFAHRYRVLDTKALFRHGVDTECLVSTTLLLGDGIPALFRFSRMHPSHRPQVEVVTRSEILRFDDVSFCVASASEGLAQDGSTPCACLSLDRMRSGQFGVESRGTYDDFYNALLSAGTSQSQRSGLFFEDGCADVKFIDRVYSSCPELEGARGR